MAVDHDAFAAAAGEDPVCPAAGERWVLDTGTGELLAVADCGGTAARVSRATGVSQQGWG